jgi:hypothetical protein
MSYEIIAVEVSSFNTTDGIMRPSNKAIEACLDRKGTLAQKLGLRKGYVTKPTSVKKLAYAGINHRSTLRIDVGNLSYPFRIQVPSIIVRSDDGNTYSVPTEIVSRERQRIDHSNRMKNESLARITVVQSICGLRAATPEECLTEELVTNHGTILTPEQQANLEARL